MVTGRNLFDPRPSKKIFGCQFFSSWSRVCRCAISTTSSSGPSTSEFGSNPKHFSLELTKLTDQLDRVDQILVQLVLAEVLERHSPVLIVLLDTKVVLDHSRTHLLLIRNLELVKEVVLVQLKLGILAHLALENALVQKGVHELDHLLARQSAFAVLPKQQFDQVFGFLGKPGVDFDGLRLQFQANVLQGPGLKGRVAVEHFVEQDPHRPHVGGQSVPGLVDHFGGHVLEGPAHGVSWRVGVHFRGPAEVAEFQHKVGVQQQIFGFDVSVCDAFRVKILQRRNCLVE